MSGEVPEAFGRRLGTILVTRGVQRQRSAENGLEDTPPETQLGSFHMQLIIYMQKYNIQQTIRKLWYVRHVEMTSATHLWNRVYKIQLIFYITYYPWVL